MPTALLIVDIQNDYFPGGTMELVSSTEAAAQAGRLLAAFRDKGLPVVHIQHIAAYPGATFFLPGTKGAEIHEAVRPRDGEPVFQKHYPNAFRETPLLEHLRANEVSRLVIVGMMTHMCVDTTVRAAADLGLTCVLAHDACATLDLSFGDVNVPAASVQAAYLAALNGIFADVRSVQEVCDEL